MLRMEFGVNDVGKSFDNLDLIRLECFRFSSNSFNAGLDIYLKNCNPDSLMKFSIGLHLNVTM